MSEWMRVKRSSLQSVADKIKSKAGTEEKMVFPQGWEDTVDAIPSGGGSAVDTVGMLLSDTLEELISENCTKATRYVCRDKLSLKKIDLPNVTHVYYEAFYGCLNVNEVNLRNVTWLEAGSTVTGGHFASLGRDAEKPFKLILSKLPAFGMTGNNIFSNCGATLLSLSRITTISRSIFNNMVNLKIIDLGSLNSIYTKLFVGDTQLDVIILRNSNGCALSNVDALNTSTPFASDGAGGTIICPQALIDSDYYRTATNWSTLNIKEILPLEGSIYEDLDWADNFDLSTLEGEVI